MLAPPSIPVAPSGLVRCHRADPRDPDAADRSWWLLCCRARHEKAVAGRLLVADVPHLLPLRVEVVRRPNRARVERVVPLFPTYVFMCGDEFDRLDALSANPRRHLSTVPVPDVPRLLADLSALLDAIESGAPVGAARVPEPGRRVRVTGGPLEGREGTMVRVAHRDMFLLEIAILGRCVPVEVEAHRCEAIGP